LRRTGGIRGESKLFVISKKFIRRVKYKGLDLILWYDILVMMQKKYHLSDSGIKLILENIELIKKNRI
jgi:hypothetical protein